MRKRLRSASDLPVKKWIMKQYWRVSQIRILTSLGLSMLVIGKLYLEFVPILRDMGLLGALTLGLILFSAFLGLGWVYDTRLKMWSQKLQANYERHAYYHVPMIKNAAFEYPVLYTLIHTIKNLSDKSEIDGYSVSQLAAYLHEYFSLQPKRKDIDRTIEMEKEFIGRHPFTKEGYEANQEIPMSSRIKLGWETQILRLTWIQSLTGLVQDVLVFGVLYVFVLFPSVASESALVLAFFGISLPLLILLVLLGWVYDRKLRIWSADLTVKIERNPYSYVLEPGLVAFTIPFFYTLLSVLYDTLAKLELDTSGVEKVIMYLDEYTKLKPSKSQDLDGAVKMRAFLGILFEEE